MSQAHCLILMPTGCMTVPGGNRLDFDALHRKVVEPAVAAAGLAALRAPWKAGGAGWDPHSLERLSLCQHAIVDVTLADAGLYYALGQRRVTHPGGTHLLHARNAAAAALGETTAEYMPYGVDDSGQPHDAASLRAALAERLQHNHPNQAHPSLYEFLQDFPDIQRLKTDVFREQLEYAPAIKQRLAEAREQGIEALRAVALDMGDLARSDAGAVVDLLLSYRAVQAWDDMINLVPHMDAPVATSLLVQEQLGLALVRAGRHAEAEALLQGLIDRHGPSSETNSLLGRSYKDRWAAADRDGDAASAARWLELAIATYLQGFESDWRDAFPGINAVNLMELKEPPDPRRHGLIPVVRYAMERRMAGGHADYWDHATRLELALLADDHAAACAALADALATVRESWEPQSTAQTLARLRLARERRGAATAFIAQAEQALEQRARHWHGGAQGG